MRIAFVVLAMSLGAASACGKGHEQDPLEVEFRARFPGEACKQLRVDVGDWEKMRETATGKLATSKYRMNPFGTDRIAIIHGPYDGPVCDRNGLCRGREQIEIAAFFVSSSIHGAIYAVGGREVGSEATLMAGCSKPGPPPDVAAEGRQQLEKLAAAGIEAWSLTTQRAVGLALTSPDDLLKAPPSECPELRALAIAPSDDEFERKRKHDGEGAAAKSCQAKLAAAAHPKGAFRIPIRMEVAEYSFESGDLMLRSLDESVGYSLRRSTSLYVAAPLQSTLDNLRELELMFPPEQVPIAVPEAKAKDLKQQLAGKKLLLDLVFKLKDELSTGLDAGAIEADVLGYRVVDDRGGPVTPWIAAPALTRPR